MKRFIIALVAGGAVFAGAFASAAALNVDGGTIQAGGDTTLACDTGTATVKWKTFVTNGAFYVAGVEIHDLDSACNGQKVLVALMKSPTEIVGFARGTIASGVATANEFYSGGTWQNGESGVGPKAADVENVQVVVKNAFVAFDAP